MHYRAVGSWRLAELVAHRAGGAPAIVSACRSGKVAVLAMTVPEAHAGLEELVDRLLAHANEFDDGTEWKLLLRPETYALLDGAGIDEPEDGLLGYRFRPSYKDTELWVVDLLGDVIAAGPLSLPGRPTPPMFYLDLADPTGRVRNNDDEPLVEHLGGG